MSRAVLAFMAILALLAVVPTRSAAAQDTGFIQVQCEPGIQIFLDGTLKGLSNPDQGGLVLEAVPVGERMVKAVKPGFTPQERRVRVAKGEVAVVKFEALRPRPTVEQSGDEQEAPIVLKVGTVIVKSVPVECKVTIERSDGAGGFDGVGEIDKTKPDAKVSNLEVGQYRVTAVRNKVTLVTTVDLTLDDEVTVFFNFVAGTVEVKSAIVERQAEEARRAELRRLEEERKRTEEAKRAEALRLEAERKRAEFVAAGGIVVDLGGGVTMNMVAIKPGKFSMGSPDGKGDDDERPAHPVEITEPFWLGQTEVTQAQWQAVMGNNPSHFTGLDRPVERVSWNDATEFCKRLSEKTGMTFRLPTEAEWEYACRGGTTTAYSFGESDALLSEFAWFSGNSPRSTQLVATRKPNAWGLYDKHGNVWEWVNDWYSDTYYESSPSKDPPGPSSGTDRVLRGGSWISDSDICRSSDRDYFTPDIVGSNLGFRAARTR
jgi:formylglycine-generating enzyme required for sulfatase activity